MMNENLNGDQQIIDQIKKEVIGPDPQGAIINLINNEIPSKLPYSRIVYDYQNKNDIHSHGLNLFQIN